MKAVAASQYGVAILSAGGVMTAHLEASKTTGRTQLRRAFRAQIEAGIPKR